MQKKMNNTYKRTTLKNGVRILTKKMPHARSVSMGVWVNVGARDESDSENGLSHMIEHMIFKGTEKRTAFQIAKEFDAIGGQTNAFTSYENTCYHARVMDTHFKTMLDILSDIFLNSVFNEEEIEKERPVIFQEIGMMEDSPEDYIHVLSGNSFWGDNPLGRTILGTRENLNLFDAVSIKNFFHRFYQPDRIIISAAGNISHSAILDMIAPLFEMIKSGNGFPERITPHEHSLVNLHYKDIEQAHICITTKGIAITDTRRYSYSLLNTILGGNMSSRLFQKIRESRGLAYSVYSFISSYVDTGLFGAYVAVHPDKIRESIDLILNEMRILKKLPVDSSELKDAKDFTIGNLMLASESIDNQMVRLAQNELNFSTQIPIQEVVKKIQAVTKDDIIDLANTLFKEDQFALTTLGPVKDKNYLDGILTP